MKIRACASKAYSHSGGLIERISAKWSAASRQTFPQRPARRSRRYGLSTRPDGLKAVKPYCSFSDNVLPLPLYLIGLSAAAAGIAWMSGRLSKPSQANWPAL
ncbi:hypothetical protein AB0H88_34830 [Nonomuraea sp. NPDC050680]|uniref:hypothetical protein n=1 Tax=Nonomuraea sp. NPDC050680 TaxID=3154630 RepID=UPI0033DD9A4E